MGLREWVEKTQTSKNHVEIHRRDLSIQFKTKIGISSVRLAGVNATC